MSISLQKGQKVSLSKEAGGLSKVVIGLGWDAAQPESKGFFAAKPRPIDCDASALLRKNGKLAESRDVVYFGNLKHYTGTVIHMGDNLTGDGDGDDEQVVVNLDQIPADYDRIVLVVNIYSAASRKQHFGMIKNAFIRLVDGTRNSEILKYNLTENYSGMTAMIFGDVYSHCGEWKLNAIGQGTTDPGIGYFTIRYQ